MSFWPSASVDALVHDGNLFDLLCSDRVHRRHVTSFRRSNAFAGVFGLCCITGRCMALVLLARKDAVGSAWLAVAEFAS